jgi:hypothetical protein
MKSAEFISLELQQQFNEDGYIIIRNLLNSNEIEQLMQLFESHYHIDGQSCGNLWNSLCDIPHDRSLSLSSQILAIVKPNLDKYLRNYVCPAATFLVKNPTPQSAIVIHRDYSVQDEPDFSYHNIWLPIVDTTPQNGQLYVLKKSHKFFDYPLPHNTPWPYMDYEKLLVEHCDVIDANAGDLVIYGDKVLHGSFDNLTAQPRPVVHFGLLHPDAKFLYHYLNGETKEVTVYDVPYQFFFENAWGNQDHRFPIVKKFNYAPPSLTQEDIIKWLNNNVLEGSIEH